LIKDCDFWVFLKHRNTNDLSVKTWLFRACALVF